MQRTLTALFLLIAAPVFAGGHTNCEPIGLSPELDSAFCEGLSEIIENAPVEVTRGVLELDADAEALIEQHMLVQEAYNADPKKTLELISRIRKAGGVKTSN